MKTLFTTLLLALSVVFCQGMNDELFKIDQLFVEQQFDALTPLIQDLESEQIVQTSLKGIELIQTVYLVGNEAVNLSAPSAFFSMLLGPVGVYYANTSALSNDFANCVYIVLLGTVAVIVVYYMYVLISYGATGSTSASGCSDTGNSCNNTGSTSNGCSQLQFINHIW